MKIKAMNLVNNIQLEFELTDDGKDLTERIAKAFRHAVDLCKSKRPEKKPKKDELF
jgi:hypothetical protein